MRQQRDDGAPPGRNLWAGLSSPTTTAASGRQNSPAPGDVVAAAGRIDSPSARSPRFRQRLQQEQKQQQQQQQSPRPKRQRGAPTAVASTGGEREGRERNQEERSRRRLAAFLASQAAVSEAPEPVVPQGADCSVKPPKSPRLFAVGGAASGDGGGVLGGGGWCDANPRYDSSRKHSRQKKKKARSKPPKIP